MLEPTTVWLVRAGSTRATVGTLRMDASGAVFSPRDASEAELRLHEVRRARRLRGSAVLEVTHLEEGATETLLLYFTEPPPLGPRERRSVLSPMRGVERTAAAMGLRAAARAKRPVVDAWARGIAGRG